MGQVEFSPQKNIENAWKNVFSLIEILLENFNFVVPVIMMS